MEDIHSILISILTNFLWIPIGAVLGIIGYWFKIRLPNRRIWKLRNPASLTISAATSTTTDTGVYHRPATGIGQARALAIATRSLTQAYNKQLDIRNILLSVEPLHERIENDLLILGGPKNNQLAEKLMNTLIDEQPVIIIDSLIIWRVHRRGNQWLDQDALEYEGKVVNRRVDIDYGLIMRTQSPFTSHDRTVVLLAGSHTYGTVAAAKFFTENFHTHLRKLTRNRRQNFVLLISSQIVDGYPTKMKVERSYAW